MGSDKDNPAVIVLDDTDDEVVSVVVGDGDEADQARSPPASSTADSVMEGVSQEAAEAIMAEEDVQDSPEEVPVASTSAAAQEESTVSPERARVVRALNNYRWKVAKLEQAVRKQNLDKPQDASRFNKPVMLSYVYKFMKDKRMLPNPSHLVGAVPGVDTGDQFENRGELVCVGLHNSFRAGIGSALVADVSVATALVMSGEYSNRELEDDLLEYVGEGGGVDADQSMNRGNLALKRAAMQKNPVRVIRGYEDPSRPTAKLYVYHGLYEVDLPTQATNEFGRIEYKFQLRRLPGQRPVNLEGLKAISNASTQHKRTRPAGARAPVYHRRKTARRAPTIAAITTTPAAAAPKRDISTDKGTLKRGTETALDKLKQVAAGDQRVQSLLNLSSEALQKYLLGVARKVGIGMKKLSTDRAELVQKIILLEKRVTGPLPTLPES
eukprot:jgi/Chlat1/5777/Chrsp387S05517